MSEKSIKATKKQTINIADAEDVLRYMPFFYAESFYLESWLNDMAGMGLVFDQIGPVRWKFKEVGGNSYRFRVLPRYHGRISDEEVKTYEKMGWEFWGYSVGALFCTSDPKAKDIPVVTDRRKEYSKGLKINSLLSLIPIIVLIYFGFIRDVGGFVADASQAIAGNGGHLFLDIAVMLAIVCLLLFWIVGWIVRPIQTAREIDAGTEMPKNRAYRPHYQLDRAVSVAVPVSVILVILALVVTMLL